MNSKVKNLTFCKWYVAVPEWPATTPTIEDPLGIGLSGNEIPEPGPDCVFHERGICPVQGKDCEHKWVYIRAEPYSNRDVFFCEKCCEVKKV